MDASCTIQDSIHVFSLVHKYVSSILGTYHFDGGLFWKIDEDFIGYRIYHDYDCKGFFELAGVGN